VSATGVSLDIVRELRASCGDQHVVEQEPGQGQAGEARYDVSPASAEEIAAVLGLANRHGLGLIPAGGGTAFPASGADVDIVLRTDRLTQVEHYDHADLTVGVGAGTTVAQLNAMVGADKLMFAGDPALPERCTIGGLLATASHGPLRHGFGAVRDYCIGVRFVTGDGRYAKGGGRVVKNVAGYDLMKLLIGSYGTLAVITSASFKLFPAPRQTRTFLAEFKTAKEALESRDRVMRSPLSPMCLELVSPGARKLMRTDMREEVWVMCVRAAGSDAVLARYRKEMGCAITRELEGASESRMWRAIENFPLPEEAERWDRAPNIFGRFNISAPPHEIARVIAIVDAFAAPGARGVGMIGRVGAGHILATAWPESAEVLMPTDDFCKHLVRNLPSNCSLRSAGASNPWPQSLASLASMRAVKQALDPKNILRGREIF
jgi:glycolate oxidase FAD binding subunit